MPFDVIENDVPLGTSKEKLPDFPHSEFPSTEFATVSPPTLAVSENVFAQLSELPKLIFLGGGVPPQA
ncbi:hypothetical protein FVW76_16130 [Salmonella enterica]|nr:hypothetical protein [Salmonella enterica]